METLIQSRERETIAHYSELLKTALALERKVETLAAIRSKEGYLAEWSKEGESFPFVENHCSICVAATLCRSFCRAELSVFRRL